MYWTRAHTETAAAGLMSLAVAVLLFRPPTVASGVLTVSLIAVLALAADRVRTRADRSRRS
jgi:hypothetical protein